MKIELRAPADVRPYPGNPRLNDDAVEAVAQSIREFGFRQPIVVDADGVVVAGHARLKAALRLGLAKVPVHVARDLCPEQARAYRLADNAAAERAEWDHDQVGSCSLSSSRRSPRRARCPMYPRRAEVNFATLT